MTRYIGIDPATSTGWAWTDGHKINYGTWGLTPANNGAAVNDLRTKLLALIDESGCDLLGFEDASFGAGRQKRTMAFHNGLRCTIESVCAERGIEFWKYNPTNIKKNTTGSGLADKKQMQAAVKRIYGLDTDNSDEADAIAIVMLMVAGIKPVGMVKKEFKQRAKKAKKREPRLF